MGFRILGVRPADEKMVVLGIMFLSCGRSMITLASRFVPKRDPLVTSTHSSGLGGFHVQDSGAVARVGSRWLLHA